MSKNREFHQKKWIFSPKWEYFTKKWLFSHFLSFWQSCEIPHCFTVKNCRVFRYTTDTTTVTTVSTRLWHHQIPTLPRGLEAKVQMYQFLENFMKKVLIFVIFDTFRETQPLLRSVLAVLPGTQQWLYDQNGIYCQKTLSNPRGFCQNCQNSVFQQKTLIFNKKPLFCQKWLQCLKTSLKHGQECHNTRESSHDTTRESSHDTTVESSISQWSPVFPSRVQYFPVESSISLERRDFASIIRLFP